VTPLNLTTAADDAGALVIDESGDSSELTSDATVPSLLDSAPTVVQSLETFKRIDALRNYRGPVRTVCSDEEWGYVLAALMSLTAHLDAASDEAVSWIAEALHSLKDSRPAEQLFHEFCSKVGYEIGAEWWAEFAERRTPRLDLKEVLSLAHAHGWAPTLNPLRIPASRFMPKVPDLNAPRTEWIVKHVLAKKSLAVVYGRWGTGKSTVAIELCAAIARGIPWHGRKVQRGTVVYVASENEHGFRARVDAYLREQGITLDALEGRFLEITGRPHLLKPDEVKELIAELKLFAPSLIVVDTLARATAGGDENTAKEMGIAVENCQTIMNETGATVVLVHHEGKDAARGMRGSSALPAACDTEIVLERPKDEENFRTAKLGKQRDAPDYCDLFNYELRVVELGADEDGDPITSTVVHEVAEKAESDLKVTELNASPIRKIIRGVLGDVMRPMSFDELVALAKTKLAPPDPGEKDRRRDRIKQAIERMVGDHELYPDANGMITPMDPANPFRPVPTTNDDLIGGVS
jgi:hypothetical protein